MRQNEFNGRQMDSVEDESLVFSFTDLISGQRAQSFSSAARAATQIDGRKLYVVRAPLD